MEGYSINVSDKLLNISSKDVELMIVPGADIAEIDHSEVWEYLVDVQSNRGLIAGICSDMNMILDLGRIW